MMEIIVDENSGFCFGVREAVRKTDDTIQKNSGNESRIYTFGPLIHNQDMIDELSAQHVEIITDLKDAEPNSIVILRSHGVPEVLYHEAKQKDITIVDATCPFVEKIHRIVKEAFLERIPVAIVGDRSHPEVIGINGWCGNAAFIIQKLEDVDSIREPKVCLVAQTTITSDFLTNVREALNKKGIKLIENNTICSATEIRQKSCENLSKTVDAMVIIGGRESSNTKKLYEIAKDNCKSVFFIERKEDLPLKDMQKYSKIGIATGASTPERIIKEVIATMSEFITESMDEMEEEQNEMHSLMAEIEKSLRLPGRNEIINGEIIQVTNREVVVNLGCKKDGILPKDEISLEPGQELTDLFKAGDMIEAKVLKTDDGDGNILLSKKKLEVNEHWDEITNAIENKSFVNAKVIKEVKGGVIAVYKEVYGFIPMSQLSDRFIEKADEFIGKVLPVRVTRVDQKRNKAVFSHKAFLNEERNKKVAEIWNSLSVGDIVEGTVMRFTDYGAFVDIGGLDGLLHISEISWGKLKHPQEALKIGEKVQTKILSMNTEKGKISLGLKQNKPEPWAAIDENYVVGAIVSGKVVQLKEYGAFIELQPGLDGLVHISEIAHKRVTNIGNEIQVGQMVSAKILEIDKDKKRISLSIKETVEPPTAEEIAAEREAAAISRAAAIAEKEAYVPNEYDDKTEGEAIEEDYDVDQNGEVEAEVSMEKVIEETADYDEPVADKDLKAVVCAYDPECASKDDGEDTIDPEDAHDEDITVPEEMNMEDDVIDKDVVLDKILV